MTKEARIYNREKSHFSKRYWRSWKAACKLMKLENTLKPYTKINLKWLIKDLPVRHDIIKFLKEKHRQTFSDINHTNAFLGRSSKIIEIKAKVNKWDLIRFRSFCIAKETVKKQKDTYGLRANDATDNCLIS